MKNNVHIVPMLVMAVCALLPRAARAEDKAGAAALFAEAGKLVDAGRPAAACPKYEESLRLFESINTRYFLADCYERIGRMASSWALFLEVAAKAHALDDPAKETKSRERATAVQPKVSHLIVAVDAKAPGIEVKRDGAPLGAGQWGVPMPVDPGMHALEASAPGKKAWSTQIEVAPNAARARIVVPELEDAPRGANPMATTGSTAPDSADADRGSGRRILALGVGGAGVVAMGIGVVLAFGAKSKHDEADPFCNGDRCEQRGVDLRDSAVARANIATVVFGVGAAAVVGGGVLWLTAPRAPKRTALGLTPGGVELRGTF